MLDEYIKLNNDGAIVQSVNAVRQGIPSAIFGVPESFKWFYSSLISGKVLVVCKDELTVHSYRRAIKSFCNKKIAFLPALDELLLVNKAFSKEMLYTRITETEKIASADIVIATAQSLMQRFSKNIKTLEIKKNCEYERVSLIKTLIGFGYKRVETVEAKGTFVVRGDIVEIFPINAEDPYHIDFFGDTVESIKAFETETRKSGGFINSVKIVSAVEITYTDEELNALRNAIRRETAETDAKRRERRAEREGDITLAIDNGDYSVLAFASHFSSDACFFDQLLPPDTTVIIDEGKRINEVTEAVEKEFTERYEKLIKEGEIFSFTKFNEIDRDGLYNRLNKYKIVALSTITSAPIIFNPLKIFNPQISGVADYRLDYKEVFADIKRRQTAGYKVIACTGSDKKSQIFITDLTKNGIVVDGKNVAVLSDNVVGGFVLTEEKIFLIGSGNLFSKPPSEKKIKFKKQIFFTAPETGDYAVHEVHGVGRVLGNKKITNTEGTKDYIAVEYYGGDILYVPVEQMDSLTRYIGANKKPQLNKIGGKDFDRIKKTVKESIKKMSFSLKQLYREREALVGYKFNMDDELMSVFKKAFPYDDTADQKIATDETLADMVNGKVMDRLICGDVGFGKTEVAFRAVFLAILNGKQSALLAPTTILTEQHFNMAKDRFRDFGVKIACLNRFRTQREQKEIVKGLADGTIDFVIATHRLLGKDITFKDLGLLVLDEEQRFGVEHKEKIKLLKKDVDTLTLSATPIPRTLNMSLSGIREISTINTPPKKRLPVQTYVTEETDTLIRDAISREINRGGQVFVMYNRVDSIYTFAEKVKNIVDGVKITVAHGQMEERQLERNVMEFFRGETQVLISTTIIENGIDLPNANTIIVIDADRLGLSTLYQLKGRVGRSDRLAYAYFTYKRNAVLNSTAYDRLNAIIEFTEMGSGIKIAMRDLQIRGAGNILGAEQHGHMDRIGYELYSKLLKEEIEGEEKTGLEFNVAVSSFIPETYIPSNSARMSVYKEIAEISSVKEREEVIKSLTDTFGEIPKEVFNLIVLAEIKVNAEKFGVEKITIKDKKAEMIFSSIERLKNKSLLDALMKNKDKVRLSVSGVPKFEFVSNNDGNEILMFKVRDFLEQAIGK